MKFMQWCIEENILVRVLDWAEDELEGRRAGNHDREGMDEEGVFGEGGEVLCFRGAKGFEVRLHLVPHIRYGGVGGFFEID